MKHYLGLCLLLLSFSSLAADQSALLMLRAVVPEKFKVEVKMTENGPKVLLHSNNRRHRHLPKFKIDKKEGNYLVSVTHP